MTAIIDDRNKAAAKHFQDTAESWTDRYREDHGLSHSFLVRRRAVEWQLGRDSAGPFRRALDLGCGTGPYLPILSRLAREVVGADVAPAMIEEARRNLPPEVDNVRLVVASVFHLPFPDSHFDIGVCVGVLEYFEDPLSVLRAAFRVVKPGGTLLFTLPNALGIARLTGLPRTLTLYAPPRWKITVGAALDRLRGRVRDPSRYYLGATFTLSRLRRLCSKAGLQLVSKTTSGYDRIRVAGLPVPARLEAAVDRTGESHRHGFPWRLFGNNLIVTIRKPTVSAME